MKQDPAGAPRSRPTLGPRSEPALALDGRAAELQRTCTRLTDNLRDTVGADGCAALLARSLARTDLAHPALTAVWRQDGREIYLDGVTAAMEQHGEAAVTAGVDALFATVVDVLGRLIGEDMAIRIIDLGIKPGEQRPGVT